MYKIGTRRDAEVIRGKVPDEIYKTCLRPSTPSVKPDFEMNPRR